MTMAKKKETPKKTNDEIRIKLDARTIISCKRAAFNYWKKQYPNAKIIGEETTEQE